MRGEVVSLGDPPLPIEKVGEEEVHQYCLRLDEYLRRVHNRLGEIYESLWRVRKWVRTDQTEVVISEGDWRGGIVKIVAVDGKTDSVEDVKGGTYTSRTETLAFIGSEETSDFEHTVTGSIKVIVKCSEQGQLIAYDPAATGRNILVVVEKFPFWESPSVA